MKTLHLVLNPVPGHLRFPLGDPHQQERQEAEEDVRFNPFVLPVIDGSQIQSCLQGPESPLDFHQLFVTQGDILRGQRVVTGGDDVLPVQMGLFFDLALVDLDRTGFQLPQVSPHCPVGKQRADVLLVTLTLLFLDGLEGFCNLFESLLAGGLVLSGFLRIMNQDKSPAALTTADNHFLDLQVLPDSGKSSPLGQNLLVNLLVVPELLPDDVMTAGLLKDQADSLPNSSPGP